ncbi:MAG: MmgE/PrpD family protein [Betaproteobacteria bacterium]
MVIAADLARHIARNSYEALPAAAILAAKRSIVDTLAVAWGARGAADPRPFLDAATRDDAARTGTIWISGEKTSARTAAFINSVAASALDFDSVHIGGAVHPDVVSVPVALAVSEAAGVSGKVVIAAAALGSDLMCRFAMSTRANSGWFYTSVYGSIVSAGMTAKLLGGSAHQIESALGLGFLRSSGTYQSVTERSSSKRALAALAVDGGILCGYLGMQGISGPRDWVEGRFGLHQMYERGDPAAIVEGLGREYRNAETSIKPYPSCQANHAPIDAALALRRRTGITADHVAQIEVMISPYMNRLVGASYVPGDNPQVAAQFSVQYSLACALARGRLGIEDICEQSATDPELVELASRVRVAVDERNSNNYCPATVHVTLKNGKALSETSASLRGGVEHPLTDDELLGKLASCLEAGGYAAGEQLPERVWRSVMALDEECNVGIWMNRLGKTLVSSNEQRHTSP